MSKKTKKSKPTKARKKSPDVGKFVEIEAKLPLTDAEKVKRGELACAKLTERDRLVIERKSVADEYKAQITALDSEAKKLLSEFTEGREIRTVKAKEIRDFKASQVRYLYKGGVIHSRTMTIADRQDDLPLKDKNVPLKKVSAIEPETKTGKTETTQAQTETKPAKVYRIAPKAETNPDPVAEAHAKDADAKRADIASTIAEQTSKKSAWTQVDGERPNA